MANKHAAEAGLWAAGELTRGAGRLWQGLLGWSEGAATLIPTHAAPSWLPSQAEREDTIA